MPSKMENVPKARGSAEAESAATSETGVETDPSPVYKNDEIDANEADVEDVDEVEQEVEEDEENDDEIAPQGNSAEDASNTNIAETDAEGGAGQSSQVDDETTTEEEPEPPRSAAGLTAEMVEECIRLNKPIPTSIEELDDAYEAYYDVDSDREIRTDSDYDHVSENELEIEAVMAAATQSAVSGFNIIAVRNNPNTGVRSGGRNKRGGKKNKKGSKNRGAGQSKPANVPRNASDGE